MTTPAERILGLAAYVRDRGAVTLDDVVADVPGYEVDGPLVPGSQAWETVRKRLQRDIKDLHDHWDITVSYDTLAERYALAPPFFTAAERRALIAAAATVHVEGVESAVPGALGSAVDDVGTQIVIRVHSLVAVLRGAIATRSFVEFGYDGERRRVAPWALGTWHNRWYLVAFDPARDDTRRFRLDRIEPGTPAIAVDAAHSAYAIPDDFDADTAFDLDPNSWGTDPVVRARVLVGPDHVDAFLAELGGDVVEPERAGSGAGEPAGTGAGDTVVELDVREYQSFRTRVLAFGGHARVVAPPVLVDDLVSHLRAVADGAP